MSDGKFVSYFRVSTARQGASGLGIEAQRKAVSDFLNGGRWKVVAEFTEVESGKNDDRKELAKALQACRIHGATLIIAKLDRLSRDAHFLLGLDKAGVDFIAADMPSANRLTIGIMAMVAEEERRMISARTKAALAAAKARGVKLGGFRGSRIDEAARQSSLRARAARSAVRSADLLPLIADLQRRGVASLGAIARELTLRSIPTARGAEVWSSTQVRRILMNRAIGEKHG